ncbi:MAG TPA: hypothetical protein VGB50_00145 [Flavobacterium sp.]|jgi:hypothetical protein
MENKDFETHSIPEPSVENNTPKTGEKKAPEKDFDPYGFFPDFSF